MRYLELLFEGKTYTSESKIDQILDQNDFNWLIDAEIENSKLEIKKNTLIWHEGTFYSGDWNYGIFKDGKLLSKKYSLNSLDEYYEPGVYKLEIYRHNYEEIFSPYKMNKNASPIYEKVLYLKASWEEKLVIKIE